MHLVINADARYIPLADESVQLVVTSPPYFGLRDYGVSGQIGLEPTPAELRRALIDACREAGGVRTFARRHGLAHGGVYDVVSGRIRNPGPCYYAACRLRPPPQAGRHSRAFGAVAELAMSCVAEGRPVLVRDLARRARCSRHVVREVLDGLGVPYGGERRRAMKRLVAARCRTEESAAWRHRAEHARIRAEIDAERMRSI